MTNKINLNDLTSLTNEQSAINTINNNNTEIEIRSDTFLSRVGTAPNQMEADLDMNNNRILNLPPPIDNSEPVRLIDISGLAGADDLTEITNLVAEATAAAATATASASSASTSATSAAASAAQLIGTASDVITIGTGSKSFNTQAGKFFDEGTWLLITSNANEANYMHGRSTSYSGGSLTVNVTNIGGSGILNDWTIRVAGTQGAAGATGATGAQGPAGSGAFVAVKFVVTSNINIATDLENGDALPAVSGFSSEGTVLTGDLVLLAGQSTAAENGVYTVVASGAASRTSGYTTYGAFPGLGIVVCEGQAYADTLWYCTSNAGGTIGATALAFSQYLAGKNYTPTDKTTVQSRIGLTQGTDVVSANPLVLNTTTGWLVDVTGITSFSAVTLDQGQVRLCRFTGVLTITHGASLVLPGAANITTAAGDYAIFAGYSGSVVRCLGYTKANGNPLKVAIAMDELSGSVGSLATKKTATPTGWVALAPGATAGMVLASAGTGNDLVWKTLSNNIDDNFGGARGDILRRETSDWNNLPKGAANTLLSCDANDPNWVTFSAYLDAVFGSATQGQSILYRGASGWTRLVNPGAGANWFLQHIGTGADPRWATVTQVLDQAGSSTGAMLYRATGATGWITVSAGAQNTVLTMGASSVPTWVDVDTLLENGLSGETNGGVLAYSGSAWAGTGAGTAGQSLKSGGSGAPTWSRTHPKTTVYTSGSGTFTTETAPATQMIEVQMVGGGGGGGGSDSSTGGAPGAASAGGNTTFGSFTASGGALGGAAASSGVGGAGGGTSGSPSVGITGGSGGYGEFTSAIIGINGMGGYGGQSYFGGAGAAVWSAAGGAATTNSGSGGAGAYRAGYSTALAAGGGGAGGYVQTFITSPAASYSYGVGAKGNGGTAGAGGTVGFAGGDGGSGIIIVKEYF